MQREYREGQDRLLILQAELPQLRANVAQAMGVRIDQIDSPEWQAIGPGLATGGGFVGVGLIVGGVAGGEVQHGAVVCRIDKNK